MMANTDVIRPIVPGKLKTVTTEEAEELATIPSAWRMAHLGWMRVRDRYQAADPAIREMLEQLYKKGFSDGRKNG